MSEEGSQAEGQGPKGQIHDMGVLDLTSLKDPGDLGGISSIYDVGIVLIPENLMGALMRIPMNDVGAVVPVPQGGNVRMLTGQTQLTGEALAAGASDTILIASGQVFITTPVREVGFKEIRMSGQLFAPRGSEAALAPRLASMNGQVLYYPEGARIVFSRLEMNRAFLEALPKPAPFMVFGKVDIASDVDAELLKSKVPEFGVFGNITAPRALVPIIEALTPEKFGSINARDTEG